VTLVIPATDVRLPSCGYGCASLMARTSRADSVRLLEAAFDAGVTHFDVARSYGYGEAESAVGEFLSRRRDRVTITTKLGIDPPRRTPVLRAARGVARRLAAGAPRLRPVLRAGASRTVSGGRFGTDDAQASLQQSLRELRTEAVDVLLLHDCRPEDLDEDLLGFLRSRVEAGEVRAFGIATDRSAARAIVAARPEFAPLVQVPDSVLHPPLAGLGPAVITHSVVSRSHARVREALVSGDQLGAWSTALDADLEDPALLARLLLAAALRRNPNGTVLWSSRSVAHVKANARLIHDPPPVSQLDVFDGLVTQLAGTVMEHET
jgi:D-threo-aldose 1-dehydrogenase